MSYFDNVVTVFNTIEKYEAILERGRNANLGDDVEDKSYNHGLNKVGKWGVVGGTIRIIYGSAQVVGGLLLSIIFGLGAWITNRQSDWHFGHKMGCERSWKHAAHGFLNIGRGFVELVPGLSYVAFARNGQEDSLVPFSENQRVTYYYEDKWLGYLPTQLYFNYGEKKV